MKKNIVYLLLGIACLLFTTAASAQETATATRAEEHSNKLRTGDVACIAGKDSFNLHYAIVPMAAKQEASLYLRPGKPCTIASTLTGPDGKTISTWSNKDKEEQCFTNLPFSVFNATPDGIYTWVAMSGGKELARILFTAQEAIIK